MKNYVCYYATTGEIFRSGKCEDHDIEVLGTDERPCLEGMAFPETHYVLDGGIVAYTAEQITAKSLKPPYSSSWSNTAFVWSDARTLEEVKDAKKQIIKELKIYNIALPKTTSFGLFDAKEEDQNNLSKVISLVKIVISRGLPGVANFTLADNSRSQFTLEQLETAALEIGAQIQGIHDHASDKRNAINNAATIVEVENINW